MAQQQLPVGFGMALAQNQTAMRKFEALTEPERETFIQRTRSVRSKKEMRQLVAELADRPDANEVV